MAARGALFIPKGKTVQLNMLRLYYVAYLGIN
jgi:hypothetical protein